MTEIRMRNITVPDANVRSPAYYVARTRAECRHCGSPTRLLALALPQEHETLDVDSQVWQRANTNAFLFHVEQLSDGVMHRIRELSEHFRPAHSTATNGLYWANHCEHCNELLEDDELHCEPDGAFLPSSEAAASEVHLLHVPEPFEAAAAGMTLEPEFFGFVRKS
jgi:hypothetical protein